MRRFISMVMIVFLLAHFTSCSKYDDNGNHNESPGDEQRTELVLAADRNSPILSSMISSFNQNNKSYKIKIVYFGSTPERTVDHLRTEIIAGNPPDIYVITQNWFADVKLPLYEDLLPYLDADPVYGQETFVPALYDAITCGGSLYYIPYDFFINSFTARESIVGDRTGLTMEEAEQLAIELGQDATVFPAWLSRMDVLNYLVNFSIAKFLDMDTGACDFLNPEFIGLLELCKAHPESPSENYSDTSLLSYSLLQTFDAFVGLHYEYGRDYSFVGFPTQDRNGSTFEISQRFSISSSSRHKDAAWDFVRMAMDAENQKNSEFFPVIQSELDKRIKTALEENETFSAARLEPFEVDKFNALVNSIIVVSDGIDTTLHRIIAEEAAAFFAGEKTAEEVAELIQSRVSLYVGEYSG